PRKPGGEIVSKTRKLGLAVAQVGGIQPAESRSAVVQRLDDQMREARSRGASFVVYPELTLTTFFPRCWYDELEEVERFFETRIPNEEVQPLFDRAKELGVAFTLGYAAPPTAGRRLL